ncbi:hypothetical protein M433DRAFT_159303 [Acidomyces richmondensis BFW]|nr:MAG: hypothetical protein FE78DRAFT_87379 [Acidomyces sp. 'richmondensis']KYG41224.1 hypothetical protein M433DRAFT_159303 [Acidomyces richmondensis BFW]
MGDQANSPRRFWLFTFPRTGSHLFLRMLNLEEQPSLLTNQQKDYHFTASLFWRSMTKNLGSKHLDEWTEEERSGFHDAFQSNFEDHQKTANAALAQGKDVWLKDHVLWITDPVAACKFYRGVNATSEEPWMLSFEGGSSRTALNETVLPDEYLKLWRPTFLIRHPALCFVSLWRVRKIRFEEGMENFSREWEMTVIDLTYHWTRSLYDWYAAHIAAKDIAYGQHETCWPIILDADDVITKPEILVKYCELVGFDSSRLKFSWSDAPSDEPENNTPEGHKIREDMRRKMTETLRSSTGPRKDKVAGEIDISEEAKKWRAEFGEESGARLEKYVLDAMPDYEYLKARRLKASD